MSVEIIKRIGVFLYEFFSNMRGYSKIRAFYFSDFEKTFKNDPLLPNLPVPNLEQTLEKYLDSVKPFVSSNQYEKTKMKLEVFRNGVGKELQLKLEERAAKTKNWLEDWWLKYTYLSIREPIAPVINMAGPAPVSLALWKPDGNKVLEKGSLCLYILLEFYSKLRHEKLAPQLSKNGAKLTMNQFRYMFNTTRIPNENFDEIHACFKTVSEGSCPTHIIVISRGHIWYMNPWYSPDERLTVSELTSQLQHIKRESDKIETTGHEIGVLTFDYRDSWAKNRRKLQGLSEDNRENLKLVEDAIAVYSLEEESPRDLNELCKYSLCGSPISRWADKSYSALTFKNGYHGTTNDHSPYDAMVGVVLAFYQDALVKDEFKGEPPVDGPIRADIELPRRLKFTVDSELKNAIENVKTLNSSLRSKTNVKFGEFFDFGKNKIKDLRIHPDAFVQCCIQLAYYKLHNKFAPTYETATTRRFFNARTETMRSCTNHMAAFVLAMQDDKCSDVEKREKLYATAKRHEELKAECENAQGVDRHLMGLYITALENGIDIPDIYEDPAYKLSGSGGNFILSTSITGYSHIIGGVAAMVPNGYGVFYGIMPEKIQFFMSHYLDNGTDVEKYFACIRSTLRQVMDLASDQNEWSRL